MTSAEISKRQADPTRRAVNIQLAPCEGVKHFLDQKHYVIPPHKSLGINFGETKFHTPSGLAKRCDDCAVAYHAHRDQYYAEHPREDDTRPATPQPRPTPRSFILDGHYLGTVNNHLFSMSNGDKVRFTFPDTYTVTTPSDQKKRIRKTTTVLNRDSFYDYALATLHTPKD